MLHYVNVSISCVRDFGQYRKTTLTYSDAIDGRTVYRLFNGCEFSDGLPPCRHCCNRVNQFLITSPPPEALSSSGLIAAPQSE